MRTSLTKETAASTLALLRDEIAALTRKTDFDDSDATAIAAKAELCSVILRRVQRDTMMKKIPSVQEEYVRSNEMCALFGISRKTLYAKIAEGNIPKPLKFGKVHVWDRKTIQSNITHAKFTN